MKKERITKKNFESIVKIQLPNIIILEPFKKFKEKILIEDSLKIKYYANPRCLVDGMQPSIQSAIDKTDAFIKKANSIHNNFYDYSESIYEKNTKKIKIICPLHGVFYPIANNHLRGSRCPNCGELSRISKQSYTFQEINTKIKNIFPDLTVVGYKNCNTPIIIQDSKNIKYKTYIYSLLKGQYPSTKSVLDSTEFFINKAIKIHKNYYNYNKVNYIHNKTKVTITCPIHGDFKQTPNSHLNGTKCPHCKNSAGYKRVQWIEFCNNKPNADPKVYIIRCFNNTEDFIKIGITSNTVDHRFKRHNKLPYKYEILKEIKNSAEIIYDKEKELHKKFYNYKYKPQISFAGETECFTTEIVSLL